MAATLKISDADMAQLRQAAALHNRSIAGQAEYWMRLGRAVERHPEMTLGRVERALEGLLDSRELSDAEQEQFLDGLGDAMGKHLTQFQGAFHQDIQAQWRGYGVTADDQLVQLEQHK